MASIEPIPIEAGDTSTNPTQQPATLVPFDAADGVDMDMGIILDLQKRNDEMEGETGQMVAAGSSSSYGPAPLPPSRTMGYRAK